jgi:peptide/nickel transport system substrate-binding protein
MKRFHRSRTDRFTKNRPAYWYLSAMLAFLIFVSGSGLVASAQDEPHAANQELTVGISRNLVNGPEDFWYAHASLQVWESLIKYDDTWQLQPGLAESWTLSPDGLTWTFKLREDVTFSNGNPFNADVVVANIHRAEQFSGRPSIFLGGINYPEIYGAPTSITATGPYEVQIAYATPRPLLPYSIANHYSAQFDPTSWDPETGNFLDKPIGTGRFTLVDWQRDQYAVLARNENYWGEKPALTKITLKLYTDPNARVSALKSGEVDALVELGALLPAQAAELAQDSNYIVAAHASACQTYIGFNGTKAPFNDPRVRKAISLAVDRDTIVNDILSGYVASGKGIVSQFNTPFFNTAPEAAATYDLDQAIALAQEALGGQTTNIVLAFTPPSEGIGQWPFPLIAQYLQATLQPLGFNIELKQLETAALTDARNNGDFDLILANSCWASPDPNYQFGRLFSSTSAIQSTQHGGYNNPEVDQLLAQAAVEIDPAKQKDLYNQVQVIAANDAVFAPLYDQQTITAAASYVKGLSQHIAYAPSFETVYIAEH